MTTHPKAEQFFERDLKNVSKYFQKLGLNKNQEQLRQDIKTKKGKI